MNTQLGALAKDDIQATMAAIGQAARQAARVLATATAERKHAALIAMAESLWKNRAAILNANAIDMATARENGISGAFLDRLELNEERIRGMCDGIRAIAELPDPVGTVIAEWDRPNGLHIERVRTPLGVIGVIFESRPNVT
ncbi:MAG: gamma-glutamyl-phosphate reductase, partial [Nitratireductor sp.]|nr:gamma-glutamyl-phosphate reductase [Nitratireductor sp.]